MFKIKVVRHNQARGRTKVIFSYNGKNTYYDLPTGLWRKLAEISAAKIK